MKGMLNKKYRRYYLAIITVVVLFLLSAHPAKAGWLANWTFEHTFGYVLFVVFSVAGKFIGALVVWRRLVKQVHKAQLLRRLPFLQ